MPRESYLRETADRLLQRVPVIMPPRRVSRTLDLSSTDAPEPMAPRRTFLPATVPGLPSVAHVEEPSADTPRAEPIKPVAVKPPAAAAPPEAAITPAAAMAPAAPARLSRPQADFVFESPLLRRPPLHVHSATANGSGATQAQQDLSKSTVPEAPAPEAPAVHQADSRTRLAAADPLAIALAAAARWTSSDTEPTAAHTPPMTVGGQPIPGASTVRSSYELTPAIREASSSLRLPGRDAPVASHESVSPAEHFTGVHIGSVEIEILPPPDAAKPPVALPAAAPAARAVTPLARGFTSSIGLRQS
jgi:hypothetical protein